jgi:TfoX/Sxy family transcriptional regulator of competence genes
VYDEALAERVRLAMGTSAVFSERKMFGGVAFLVGGNMACGIVRDELMVRTGPARYEECLARPEARPMDFTGRPMRSMVFVDVGDLDEAALTAWVDLGVTFAASLPPK